MMCCVLLRGAAPVGTAKGWGLQTAHGTLSGLRQLEAAIFMIWPGYRVNWEKLAEPSC